MLTSIQIRSGLKTVKTFSLLACFAYSYGSAYQINEMAESDSRQLQSLYTTTTSSQCKEQCLDGGNVFCIKANGKSGYCCASKNCPKVDICSFDALSELKSLQWWSCPHDPDICGDDLLYVANSNGSTGKIVPGPDVSSDFKFGQLCNYKISFPSIAGALDQIELTMTTLEKATAYFVVTGQYTDEDAVEQTMSAGQSALIYYPFNIYATILSDDSNVNANFQISFKFINRDPTDQDLIEYQEQPPIKEFIIQEVIIEQEASFIGTTNFYLVIGFSVLAIGLVIALICCLRRMRKKNLEIMTKVQVLQKAQNQLNKDINTSGISQPNSKPFIAEEGEDNDFVMSINNIMKDDSQKEQFDKFLTYYMNQQKSAQVDGGATSLNQSTQMRIEATTPDPARPSSNNKVVPTSSQNDDAMVDAKVLAMKELLRRDNVDSGQIGPQGRSQQNSSHKKKPTSTTQQQPQDAQPRAVLSSNTGLGGFGGAQQQKLDLSSVPVQKNFNVASQEQKPANTFNW